MIVWPVGIEGIGTDTEWIEPVVPIMTKVTPIDILVDDLSILDMENPTHDSILPSPVRVETRPQVIDSESTPTCPFR
jgi:hypothetical protein